MPSFIAAFALQQLRDMEELQRDLGRRRSKRRRRDEVPGELAPAVVRKPSALWAPPQQARRIPGVSASTKGATEG
jgi:hypothetical protein